MEVVPNRMTKVRIAEKEYAEHLKIMRPLGLEWRKKNGMHRLLTEATIREKSDPLYIRLMMLSKRAEQWRSDLDELYAEPKCKSKPRKVKGPLCD